MFTVVKIQLNRPKYYFLGLKKIEGKFGPRKAPGRLYGEIQVPFFARFIICIIQNCATSIICSPLVYINEHSIQLERRQNIIKICFLCCYSNYVNY